ncbi:hypothetical protein HU200_048144 [Digitaria exilis]|uniref:Uncharacterized protein n=1 Tax=Digitaria exilis TaxID=1010633 RepID=A0A835AT83_9POAL|nr:hypothetical protein HU200_048144 [Digitaria exilis]CAB3498346.1 unnamed protein product [Digitaria exilis]
MSRRARHPAAASRRTRRSEQQPPPPPASLAESPKILSNPIFRCEPGPSLQPKPAPTSDQLRCVYRPGSLYALVHDPAAAGDGIGKPLPLPPCRAHRAGSHLPASRVGLPLVVGSPRGRVARRAPPPPQDPFLAAYVACSNDAGGVDRRQQKQREGRKKKTTTTAVKKKEGREGEEDVRGCGMWSGWAAGAKYAGEMSCRHGGCAVAEQQKGDAPAALAMAKKEVVEEDAAAAAAPTLDLSWAPVVLSARALERRREQR